MSIYEVALYGVIFSLSTLVPLQEIVNLWRSEHLISWIDVIFLCGILFLIALLVVTANTRGIVM